MDALYYDGPLEMTEGGMDDWHTITKAEHEGVTEVRWSGGHGRLYCSDRVSDACVEGTRAEMVAIANGIKARTPVSFRRCAVSFDDGMEHALFRSPRNSSRPGMVPIARAVELADAILADTGGDSP